MAENSKHGQGALRRYAGGKSGSYDAVHGAPAEQVGAHDDYSDEADSVTFPKGKTAPAVPDPIGGAK